MKEKMIYTDSIHLIADNIDELHAFAKKLGLSRDHYQGKKPRHPYYDLFGFKKRKAIKLGAKLVSTREIVKICQLHYGKKEPYKYQPKIKLSQQL